jgi:hypothetical protein
MTDLDHLAKEFEKVHDALPSIFVRLTVVEKWQEHHPETHRLEAKALDLAKAATDIHLEHLNKTKEQLAEDRADFVKREVYDREHQRICEEIDDLRESRDSTSGEKSLLEKFWPLFLAALMYAVGHFWK